MNRLSISDNKYIGFLFFVLLVFSVSEIYTQNYQKADLPDAMTFLNGKKVKSVNDFLKRKEEIRNLWCDYYIGHFPKEVPKLLSAEVIKTVKHEDGSTRKRIVLTFDTPNKKSFEIAVWEPNTINKTATPLFLTQPRYYQIQWAEEAVKRGYVTCLYPGLDTHHSEDDFSNYQNIWKIFKDEYPDAGWASSLGIQAWLASRTLDYFLDKKNGYAIDTAAVGIAGHSRYGKQSIYAAAFDERFKSVIARSSGTPTATSYRFASRQTFMESVSDSDCPKDWVLDELSDYYGRENELPIEGNSLLAAIAPRHLMLHTALNDGSDPTFGVERSYLNAKKAYQFLGVEHNIQLSYRAGNHNPITEAHTDHMFDFFDMSFGRGTAKREDFPEVLHHDFDWGEWQSKQRKEDMELSKNTSLKEKINWMLGEQPEAIPDVKEYHIIKDEDLPLHAEFRDRWMPGNENLKRVPFAFGDKMQGNIIYVDGLKKYKGTVIWLHPWNYSHGSNESYGVEGTTVYYRLALEGYKVVMYDQFGFGDHLTHAFDFYKKHPHWSLLGRAVSDVSKVLDYLVAGKGISAAPVPKTDASKIYVFGFSYGAMVGLYAAALDNRITGVASFSGFTPMRTDTDAKPTGGIRKYWQWHHVLPKLGLYHNREQEIPYDYDDVIKLIAPRNCLIYSPTRDRFSDIDDLKECIEKIKNTGGTGFQFISPDDVCRFQKDQHEVLIEWLGKL
ncbi:alpha/beta hydrolase family protein [Kriegella aquimaris]|uniref:Alpha/beta hydrolase family protein n=1 Tax=Kriegella aquimaris TaxID=192904 RepID=A0A1G9JD92_9FLAO|nr:alpha/beta hydrolase [Kriegella aquimaris]SDL35103.1 Alpha/beta hydrolase family protein [Kriegella aquimaris]